jgi:hypothetical protein
MTAILRLPALRRALAAVCAVAFLVVGFAHSLHHFNAMTPAAAYQTGAGVSSDSPDTTKKAAVAVEHCHGCVMIAMAALTPPTLPIPVLSKFSAEIPDHMRPYLPVAEPPPPIFTI